MIMIYRQAIEFIVLVENFTEKDEDGLDYIIGYLVIFILEELLEPSGEFQYLTARLNDNPILSIVSYISKARDPELLAKMIMADTTREAYELWFYNQAKVIQPKLDKWDNLLIDLSNFLKGEDKPIDDFTKACFVKYKELHNEINR